MRSRILIGAILFTLTAMVSILAIYGAGNGGKQAKESAGENLWTEEEWEKARLFSPLRPPPPDPTNALSANEGAARLGHQLFFDIRLSPQAVACATCHEPERGFTDGLPVANTLAPLHRNTMPILNVGHFRWLTWDGSRDSLWNQAMGPIESPEEMGSSRLFVVKAAMRHYGRELGQFIKFPKGWMALWPDLPESGKPGDPAFDTLSPAQKDAVNQVFSSTLKVIAAYEMRVVSEEAPFDQFVAGDHIALSLSAQRGFQHFLRMGCDICHNTPLFSDDEFHNVGLPLVPRADLGRAEGLERLKKSLFRGTGPYADGPPVVRAEDYQGGVALVGTFRTPSLRELKLTAPYGHNGSVATLEEAIDHYIRITSSHEAGAPIGTLDPALPRIEMTPEEKKELIEFLLSLSSDYDSVWTREPVGLDE